MCNMTDCLPWAIYRANASHVILILGAYQGPQLSTGDLSLLRPYFEYLFVLLLPAPPRPRVYNVATSN